MGGRRGNDSTQWGQPFRILFRRDGTGITRLHRGKNSGIRSRRSAFLGAGDTLNVPNRALFPNAFEHRFVAADQDFFRVVARHTGTLDFQVYFRHIAEFLPGAGNVQIEVDAEVR